MNESKTAFSQYPIKRVSREEFGNFPLLARLLNIVPENEIPKQIYYRGTFPTSDHYLAVVGSRAITSYGERACNDILSGLKGQNICIISGLALGADAQAHKNALENNLVTIGVPGSSIEEDKIGPKANKNIAKEILQNGGLLLSEIGPDDPVGPWSFPARNRIMAALCDAVLLVEAAPLSGTLITARLATDYNKDVLCIPGPIDSENSKGTNKLISEGARLIQDSTDILHQFRITPKDLFETIQ